MSMFEILEYRLNLQIQYFVDNPWSTPSLCSVIDWAQGNGVLTYRQLGTARRVIKRQLAGTHPSHPFAIWVLAPQTARYPDRIGEDGRRYAGNLWKCWCRAVLNIADKECGNG